MTLGELITARRLQSPVKIVVFADRELNLIKLKQSWRNAGFTGVALYDGDLFQEESVLGIKVIRADHGRMMKRAVREALEYSGQVIIEARIDPSDYAQMISPGN